MMHKSQEVIQEIVGGSSLEVVASVPRVAEDVWPAISVPIPRATEDVRPTILVPISSTPASVVQLVSILGKHFSASPSVEALLVPVAPSVYQS